jgi:CheY-like chemotaxis protein
LTRKILLADDSVTAQNMGRKILADAGYEVLTVNNGSAALKKIAESKPDLVVLDVYMPGYSGLEVCQRLKESGETARIPVLLSVGKLEPFKPEEAQRVRAEGYIVKPFEASELLAALTKLEDKIVPRPEPSKPGRFARAIAAVEESSRAQSAAPAEPHSSREENGWKERIAFPHQKTEAEKAEQKAADDPALYNAMNRDLRTVVETPEEMATERAAPAAAEPSVDVAALVTAGLPTDVTREEVAAIAAASVQIQLASEALKEDSAPECAAFVEQDAQRGTAEFTVAQQDASLDRMEDRNTDQLAHGAAQGTEGPAMAAGTFSEPMTMAALSVAAETVGPAGASRWSAVAAPLQGDEAGVALEKEMQESHAAFVRETNSGAAEATPEVEAGSPVEEAKAEEEARPAERVESQQSRDEPSEEYESNHEPVAASGGPEVHAEPREPVSMGELNAPEVVQKEAGPESSVGEGTSMVGTAASDGMLERAEPVSRLPVASPELRLVGSEVAPSSHAFVSIVHEPEIVEDADAVKATAAAWASWRQIRDSNAVGTVQASPREESALTSPKMIEEAAMAVAAGAEKASGESSSLPQENPADIASIVDSVLADLRPKLMAEISRKMAEK